MPTLRHQLESGWILLLRERVGLGRAVADAVWDCDFLFGEQHGAYVLCEINVSSMSPFPPSAIPRLVAAVKAG
jgi:hypothetical protein